jgi:5-oxoprolinase (ATP-hydrolysing) subunit C
VTARVVILRPGAAVTIQDGGRRGYRALGVPLSGSLDPILLAAANVLASAPETAAGLEILLAAPELRVESGVVRIGLAGDLSGAVIRAGGARENVASWRGLILRAGDALTLRLGRGPAYLAFSGGLDLPLALNSRSTFARARLGGLDGRPLKAGDLLRCGEATADGDVVAPPLPLANGPIRFMPGPQAERFSSEALALFTQARWRVGADSDRMGLRLSGPRLAHDRGGANIVTDGVTPGAIQVPGDGQPIVLRADCQTSGGYAKIGCVISADLPRLAHAAPGDLIAFAPADHDEAAMARARARQDFADWRARIAPSGSWNAGTLWSENLISGATSGDWRDPP